MSIGNLLRKIGTASLCLFGFATLSHAESNAVYPLVFDIDGVPVVSADNAGAKIVARNAEQERKQIDALVNEIVAASNANDAKKMSSLLTRPSDSRKAMKFLKMFSITDEKQLSAPVVCEITDSAYALAFKPSSKKFRRGMNLLLFKKVGEELKWNLSANDPLLALIADSAAFATPQRFEVIRKDGTAQKRKSGEVQIPVVVFGNSGSVLDLNPEKDVDALPAPKFYHAAQTLFYGYQLETYADFLTSEGRKTFSAQYLGLSSAEQKTALAEYFSWKKKYLKLLDGGDIQILIFKRLKENSPEQIDLVYLMHQNGKFNIANFGAKKSAFDLFLSKYIFSNPEKDYALKVLENF